jgi:hypothetical protein
MSGKRALRRHRRKLDMAQAFPTHASTRAELADLYAAYKISKAGDLEGFKDYLRRTFSQTPDLEDAIATLLARFEKELELETGPRH